MTGQMADEFIYEGESFSLAGFKGVGLYTPEDFGMNPYDTCTACWRGYLMRYTITEKVLFLDKMQVNANTSPKINGVSPIEGGFFFKYSYENLNLKSKFTGELLLAKDFIEERYVHMGFQSPTAYRTVIEFSFENGNLTKIRDLSKKISEYHSLDSKGEHPESLTFKKIMKWIDRRFSLDYDFD